MELWSLEYNDCCEGWSFYGLFSSKEKAEAYRDAHREDLATDLEDYRIVRESLDPEY